MSVKKTSRGFTLIEVIISLAIIITIITGYSFVFFSVSKTQNKTNIELNALIIAQNELEKSYANSTNLVPGSENLQYTIKRRDYNMEKNVQLLDQTESSYKYLVEVTVSSEDINPVVLATVIYSFNI